MALKHAAVTVDNRVATGTTQAQRAAAMLEMIEAIHDSPNIDMVVKADWDVAKGHVPNIVVHSGGMCTVIDRKGNRT